MDAPKANAVGHRLDGADRPPTFPVRLVCWHCGATREILTQGPAQFGFEVAAWADGAGMRGYFDLARGRVLVFCSGDHARQQMTKSGRFRLRPLRPGPASSAPPGP